jgi:hypothetical protein
MNLILVHVNRSKTNLGELCKQKFLLFTPTDKSNESMENSIIIHKYVLSINEYKDGYKMVKKYKDKILYEQTFGLKLSTLGEMVNWLNNL